MLKEFLEVDGGGFETYAENYGIEFLVLVPRSTIAPGRFSMLEWKQSSEFT